MTYTKLHRFTVLILVVGLTLVLLGTFSPTLTVTEAKHPETEVKCVEGYKWVILYDSRGDVVDIEQMFEARGVFAQHPIVCK